MSRVSIYDVWIWVLKTLDNTYLSIEEISKRIDVDASEYEMVLEKVKNPLMEVDLISYIDNSNGPKYSLTRKGENVVKYYDDGRSVEDSDSNLLSLIKLKDEFKNIIQKIHEHERTNDNKIQNKTNSQIQSFLSILSIFFVIINVFFALFMGFSSVAAEPYPYLGEWFNRILGAFILFTGIIFVSFIQLKRNGVKND